MASVVEQGIHCFLQHALLVANDDIGRAQLQQVLEAVIPVDHAAIQIIEIAGGKTSAFQRNQWTEIRRNHRQHFKDHPFRTHLGIEKTLRELQPLGNLLADLFALGRVELMFQLVREFAQVNFRQGFLHGLGAHLGGKAVGVLLTGLTVLHLGEQLLVLQWRLARIDDHVIFVIQHAFEITRRHVQHQAHARRHALEKPNMADRHRQFDVAHAFPAHAGQRHLDAATITDHAAMLDALVLAAITFPITHRTENPFTKQTALFRLKCAVVDRFRVLDFPV